MTVDDAGSEQRASAGTGQPPVERAAEAAALLADLQRQVAEGIRARAIAESRDPDAAAQTSLAEELLAERAAEAQCEEELMQHYARMYPGGRDDPEDADGLAIDRALAAAASGCCGKSDGHDKISTGHHALNAVLADGVEALPVGNSPN